MSNEVLDLDVLRPKPRKVKIGGKTVDASFVPVGIVWDVQAIVDALMQYTDEEKIRTDREVQEHLLDLSCELCGVFASWQEPELTAEWFRNNADSAQIGQFVEVIKETLMRSYDGIEAYQGNAKAAQPTAP